MSEERHAYNDRTNDFRARLRPRPRPSHQPFSTLTCIVQFYPTLLYLFYSNHFLNHHHRQPILIVFSTFFSVPWHYSRPPCHSTPPPMSSYLVHPCPSPWTVRPFRLPFLNCSAAFSPCLYRFAAIGLGFVETKGFLYYRCLYVRVLVLSHPAPLIIQLEEKRGSAMKFMVHLRVSLVTTFVCPFLSFSFGGQRYAFGS